MEPFRQFRDVGHFEAALSAARPLVIFKHSATCGLSAMAAEQVQDVFARRDRDVDVYLVPVRAQRALSQTIAARLGVRHESPQILLIKAGRLVWHASHFRVSASEIAAAFDRIAGLRAGATL